MDKKCPFILRFLPVAVVVLCIALVGLFFWRLDALQTEVIEPRLIEARTPELRRQTFLLLDALKEKGLTPAIADELKVGDYLSFLSGKYWQVTTEDNVVYLRSSSLGQGFIPKVNAPFAEIIATIFSIPFSAFLKSGSKELWSVQSVQLEGGKAARLLIAQTTMQVSMAGREPQTLTVRIAEDTAPFMESFFAARNMMVVGAAFFTLLLTGLSVLALVRVKRVLAKESLAADPLS